MAAIQSLPKGKPGSYATESCYVPHLWRSVLLQVAYNINESNPTFCVAATTIFMPYITLHMIQIGITIEEVAIIYLILPFASCIGPPIAGEYRYCFH